MKRQWCGICYWFECHTEINLAAICCAACNRCRWQLSDRIGSGDKWIMPYQLQLRMWRALLCSSMLSVTKDKRIFKRLKIEEDASYLP